MAMMRLVVVFLAANFVHGRLSRSDSVKLNTSAVTPKSENKTASSKVDAATVKQSMPDIGALLKNAEALQTTTVSPQAAAGGNRKKLDVGLNDFEIKLEDEIVTSLFAQLPNSTSESARGSFNSTLRSVFKASFLDGVKSTKQKVAHNWLQLKPEKRENYFSAVKSKYLEIFGEQEKRLKDRIHIAFFSDADFPPKASDTQVKQNTEKLASKIVKPLCKQLSDYAEMFYMSNIFLRFRVKMSKKVLALATENSVLVI